LVHIPTGAGKTAAVVLSWIWRRRAGKVDYPGTPRRLVYCLPVRVLVEQTAANARSWVESLRKAGLPGMEAPLPVYVLMGGEEPEDWATHPEQEAILVGTEDMLLSRALNRGYASSPFRWPREFGLLNNDCLWVFDEIQLMDVGLATSAQMAAFRTRFGTYGSCPSLWMSATLDREWLRTVDFQPAEEVFRLGEADRRHAKLAKRLRARKVLSKGGPQVSVKGSKRYATEVARLIEKEHRTGSLTLVVVNTVERARDIYRELRRLLAGKHGGSVEIRLIHSRFRPYERQKWAAFLGPEAPIPGGGRIVVSTQVVEAGVDVSATTLITELAPWSALVQRIGRCNRFGENEESRVIWLDVAAEQSAPYSPGELQLAGDRLNQLEGRDVSPQALEELPLELPYEPYLLRLRDFIDLFDTTPDLSENVVDISRFIRSTDEPDAFAFWRAFEGEPGEAMADSPIRRDELCPVPISQLRLFLESHEDCWVWDRHDGRWRTASAGRLRPGEVVLIRDSAGGYETDAGWSPEARSPVPAVPEISGRPERESLGSDQSTEARYWQTLKGHARRTAESMRHLLGGLTDLDFPDDIREACLLAALLHDVGKAHAVFQESILRSVPLNERAPRGRTLWAKSPHKIHWHTRPFFRHELAAALALLNSSLFEEAAPQAVRHLVCYLVAAHHGKVRISVRSLPGEEVPPDGRRFARGVWEGDRLPTVDFGDVADLGHVMLPETKLDLGPLEIGLDAKGRASWLERTLALRDRADLGPFRLAYLEALVRAADVRASEDPGSEEVEHA